MSGFDWTIAQIETPTKHGAVIGGWTPNLPKPSQNARLRAVGYDLPQPIKHAQNV